MADDDFLTSMDDLLARIPDTPKPVSPAQRSVRALFIDLTEAIEAGDEVRTQELKEKLEDIDRARVRALAPLVNRQ